MEHAKTCHIAILHAVGVERNGSVAIRILARNGVGNVIAEDTLREHITSLREFVGQTCRVEAEMSWVVEERPSRIVGVVVPLPLQSESRFREGVVRRQIGLWIGLAHIWLGVWLACGSHIRSVVAQHWPTVHPFHWLKIRDTSHGASVLEENRPPLAHLCLNQSTLMNLLVFEHAVAAFLVRSERTLGAENGLRTLGAAVGSINVIVVSDVVEVGTLATIASDLGLSVYDGTMSATATLPTGSGVILENQLAIVKLNTIKDDADNDITASITSLTISDGYITYTVNRTAVEGPIYVAMRPVSSEATITFTASDGTKNYEKSVTGQELEMNKIYPINLKLK